MVMMMMSYELYSIMTCDRSVLIPNHTGAGFNCDRHHGSVRIGVEISKGPWIFRFLFFFQNWTEGVQTGIIIYNE